MVIPTSGAINLNNIHTDGVGGSSGSAVSMNDSDIRGLIGTGSGATMSMSEWYLNPVSYVSEGYDVSSTAATNIFTGCNAGDLIIVTIAWARTTTPTTPSRTSSLVVSGATSRTVSSGKSTGTYSNNSRLCYRIATQSNDYYTKPASSSTNRYNVVHQVYRPAKTISNLSWTTLATTPDNTTDAPRDWTPTVNSGARNNTLFVLAGGVPIFITAEGDEWTSVGGGGSYAAVSTIYDANGGTYSGSVGVSSNSQRPANGSFGYFRFS